MRKRSSTSIRTRRIYRHVTVHIFGLRIRICIRMHRLVIGRNSILLWSQGERYHVFVLVVAILMHRNSSWTTGRNVIRNTSASALFWSRRLVVDFVVALHHSFRYGTVRSLSSIVNKVASRDV